MFTMIPDRVFVAEKFYRWINRFPDPSLNRLKRINNSSADAGHVILSLGYAVYDCNIRALNNLIVKLLLTRMQAQRRGEERIIERTQVILTGLHVAIDWATGKLEHGDYSHLEQDSCNKIAKN